MSRFKDRYCPVCRVTFKDTDDIVVCPECGTPHHRECYMSIGECGVSAYHAEGFVWKGMLPDEEKKAQQEALEKAAQEVEDRREFVSSDPHVAEYPSGVPGQNVNSTRGYGEADSGNGLPEMDALSQIPDPYQSVYRSIREITEDEVRGKDGVSGKELCYFAGKSIIHYAQAFNAFRNGVMRNGKLQPVKVFFNFCSGLFSPIHQFYRRMDILGIVMLLISGIASLPGVFLYWFQEKAIELSASMVSTLDILSAVGNFIGLGSTVLLCVFGDYLYYRYCVRRIKRIRVNYDDGKAEGYYTALTESGAPSRLRAVIGILANMLMAQFVMRLPLIL